MRKLQKKIQFTVQQEFMMPQNAPPPKLTPEAVPEVTKLDNLPTGKTN